MSKETIYRKVAVSERVPENSYENLLIVGWNDTHIKHQSFYAKDTFWCMSFKGNEPYEKIPDYWLEEIQLPSEEEIEDECRVINTCPNGSYEASIYNEAFLAGANYILNKIKGNG